MGTEFTIGEMTRFETREDGSSIRLDMEDVTGRRVSLHMPLDCLTRLIMTLPGLVTQAVRRQCGDPTLRMVLPVERCTVDPGDGVDPYVLTVNTPDGFHMSFALTDEQRLEIGAELQDGPWLTGPSH